MVTIYDVDVNQLIENTALELNKVSEVKAPEWSVFVKTGNHKERPPARDDWWNVRAAAILLKVHKIGPIGVAKLRVKYGGKKNRGHKPSRFVEGSGSIIRKVLQQLEKAGLIEQVKVKENEKGGKGRVITGKGLKILNQAAKQTAAAAPKKEVVKPALVVEKSPAQPVPEKPVAKPAVESKPVDKKEEE